MDKKAADYSYRDCQDVLPGYFFIGYKPDKFYHKAVQDHVRSRDVGKAVGYGSKEKKHSPLLNKQMYGQNSKDYD